MTINHPKTEEEWEEKFDKGFSFEGNNDPNKTPKMMFGLMKNGRS